MSSIFRTIILVGIITAILGMLGNLFPINLGVNINNSIIYFLSYLNYLSPFLPVNTLLSAIQFYFNALMGIIAFVLVIFIIKLF